MHTMKKLVSFIKKDQIILMLILLIATIVRLVPLEKLMIFSPDQSYILYIVQTLVKNFHIIWIGVSALGFDFYMGPGWIYFLYPFIALFKNDPLVIGVISSLIGVITTWVIYWFGKKLIGTKVGLLAALFYGTSSLIVYYDQQPYPNAVPLLSLFMALSLYMSKKSKKWLYLFAASYGAVFHIHLSLILVIFAGIYWVIKHKLLDKKIFMTCIVIFLVTISPLVVFDYYHKASNITAPIRVIQTIGNDKAKPAVNNKINSTIRILSRLWYLNAGNNNVDEISYPCNTSSEAHTTQAKLPLTILSLTILIFFFLRKDFWSNEKKNLLFSLSLCFIVPYLILNSINAVEYYLLGFFPLFFIIAAYFFTSFKKPFNYIIYLFVCLFVIYNVYTVFVASGEYGLKTKKTMVNKVMKVIDNDTYELSEEGGVCQGAAGWRYMYITYGRRPVRSSEDKSFSWLWPDEIGSKKAKYSVVMEERRTPKTTHKGYKVLITEGGFNAYIYQN